MRLHGVLLTCAALLVSGAAAAQTGDPPQLDDPLWLVAQTPPAQPGGGSPPPPPRPPVGMGPGGVWWRNSEIAKRLALTDGQVAQIDKVVLEHRLKLVDLRATLDKEELKLQPLLDAERLDEAKVSAQLDQIIAARGKLDKANSLMLLAMRRALSQEQWRTLQGIQQERERGRGRPGEESPDRRGPPRGGPAEAPPGG